MDISIYLKDSQDILEKWSEYFGYTFNADKTLIYMGYKVLLHIETKEPDECDLNYYEYLSKEYGMDLNQEIYADIISHHMESDLQIYFSLIDYIYHNTDSDFIVFPEDGMPILIRKKERTCLIKALPNQEYFFFDMTEILKQLHFDYEIVEKIE